MARERAEYVWRIPRTHWVLMKFHYPNMVFPRFRWMYL